MVEILGVLAIVVAIAVGSAAFVLNVYYIRLARSQLANADRDAERIEIEIRKLGAERTYYASVLG